MTVKADDDLGLNRTGDTEGEREERGEQQAQASHAALLASGNAACQPPAGTLLLPVTPDLIRGPAFRTPLSGTPDQVGNYTLDIRTPPLLRHFNPVKSRGNTSRVIANSSGLLL